MDSHKITNVFMDSSPGALDATSRDYVDNLMHHSQVQPSHQKDEFAYLMANMLEWTDLTSGGGNGFNMTKIANLSTSKGNFHSNNKKVIYTTIIKKRSRRIQVQNGNSMLQIAKKLLIMPSVLRFWTVIISFGIHQEFQLINQHLKDWRLEMFQWEDLIMGMSTLKK